MNKMKLTQNQVFDLAAKIFDEVNEGEGFGELRDQNGFVKNDWVNVAYDAIEGYNCVVAYINASGILDDIND